MFNGDKFLHHEIQTNYCNQLSIFQLLTKLKNNHSQPDLIYNRFSILMGRKILLQDISAYFLRIYSSILINKF
ncbi:hypothetical protein pb186bvf_002281 [Paramecium bursaria]